MQWGVVASQHQQPVYLDRQGLVIASTIAVSATAIFDGRPVAALLAFRVPLLVAVFPAHNKSLLS